MKPKKKNINTQEISKEYMDCAVDEYERSSSMREAARALDISPMKLRKILITAGVFESGVSKEIKEMYSSGMSIVSAKYSCGFPDPQVLPIIVVERYLDYFTTIMEDRLWQVLAKPVFRWKNKFGLSTD